MCRAGAGQWCASVPIQPPDVGCWAGLGWAGMPRLVRPLSSPRTTTQSTAASLAASTLPPAGRHTLGVLIEWNSLSKGIKVDRFVFCNSLNSEGQESSFLFLL